MLGSNLIATFCNLVIGIVLSRNLGPGGFGVLSALLVLPMIMVGFVQLGIRRSAIYYLGNKQFDENKTVSTILLLLFLSSLAGILLTGAGFLFYRSGDFQWILILLVLISIPMKLALQYLGGIFLGKQQIGRSNTLVWIPALMNLCFVALFVWFLKMQVLGALIAIFLSDLIVSAEALRKISGEFTVSFKLQKQIIQSILRLGILYALSFFIMQLNYRADLILLKQLSTNEQVGFYSLANYISEQLWHIPLAVEAVILSHTANASDHDLLKMNVAKVFRLSILAGIGGVLAIYLIAPILVPLLFSAKFTGSIPLIRNILPGIFLIILFRILNSHLAGLGKPMVAIYIFLPALILNILLNLLWIPSHGAMGAVWATNCSYALGAIVFLFIYCRVIKINIYTLFSYKKTDFHFSKRRSIDHYGNTSL